MPWQWTSIFLFHLHGWKGWTKENRKKSTGLLHICTFYHFLLNVRFIIHAHSVLHWHWLTFFLLIHVFFALAWIFIMLSLDYAHHWAATCNILLTWAWAHISTDTKTGIRFDKNRGKRQKKSLNFLLSTVHTLVHWLIVLLLWFDQFSISYQFHVTFIFLW